MARLVSSIFLFETVEDVAYTQAITGNLVGIGRTYALSGCTYLALTLGGLKRSVEQAVCGHDEMCLLGDMEPVF